MNFAANTVHTQTPQLMDLGFSAINVLYESSVLGTPATKIRRPTDESHWSDPNHDFGEATVIGISEVRFNHDYNYKTRFQVWKENKEF